MKRYKVITLCGSNIYKSEFLRIQKELTLDGNIVLIPILYDEITEEKKQALKEMHMQKIEMADEVYVLNFRGVLGEDIEAQVNYALSLKKKVEYIEMVK